MKKNKFKKKRVIEDMVYTPSRSHRQQIIDFVTLNKLAYHDEFSGKYYLDIPGKPLEGLNEYNKEDLRTVLEEHLYKLDRHGNKIALSVGEDGLKSGLAGGSIKFNYIPVSYTHLTLPTNREV